MADGLQHRQVGFRVGVRIRLREVDAVALGDLPDRLRLPTAVREGSRRPSRVTAVADLRAEADAAVEAEHVREHLRQLLGRRGNDVDGPAGVLMAVRLSEHLRVHARQHTRENVGREARQVDHPQPGDRLEHARLELLCPLVGGPAHAKAQVRPQVARELPAAHHPRSVSRPPEVDRARALDERLIEIEERRAAHRFKRIQGAVALRRSDLYPHWGIQEPRAWTDVPVTRQEGDAGVRKTSAPRTASLYRSNLGSR